MAGSSPTEPSAEGPARSAPAGPAAEPAITTVGHGTLDAPAFAALLADAGIDAVVDVRRYPGSRRHPHFAREAMEVDLPARGVSYRWLPSLGGRRAPQQGSENQGLRNPQFRAYADHMASPTFAEGVEALLQLAAGRRAAVLCSETVWWRCHRRLLADHLVLVEGAPVEHLFHDRRRAAHPVTPEARRAGDHVVYRAHADDGTAVSQPPT